MNIRNEELTDLTQKLVVEIVKDDYANEVENALKKQRQKAVIPGFRPGNVPMGMIKKMYYKSILLDHLNRMVTEQLSGYLKDKKIIFEPLPVDEDENIDFDSREDFTFSFEYALYPQIEVEWDKLPAVKRFTVKASDKEIDEYTTHLRKRHGKYTNPDTILFEDDYISVSYDNDKRGYFHLNLLNNECQALLKGKKLKEEVEISFVAAFNTIKDLVKFLKIEEEDIEEDNPYTYTVTIESVGRIEMAEYNEEFFQKAFPDGNVKNEEELKELAAKEIEKQWEQETSRVFMNNAIGVFLEHVTIELPDDFIKRYLLVTQKDMTTEKLELQYPEILKSIKWQLIENKLSEENNLTVTEDDIKAHIREFYITNYFAQFRREDIEERLDELVTEAMKNKKDVKKIYDVLFDKKMETLLVKKMNLEEQSGDFEAFIDTLKSESTKLEEENKELKKQVEELEKGEEKKQKTEGKKRKAKVEEDAIGETITEGITDETCNESSVTCNEEEEKPKRKKTTTTTKKTTKKEE